MKLILEDAECSEYLWWKNKKAIKKYIVETINERIEIAYKKYEKKCNKLINKKPEKDEKNKEKKES